MLKSAQALFGSFALAALLLFPGASVAVAQVAQSTVDLLVPAPADRSALEQPRFDESRQRPVRIDVGSLRGAARSGGVWNGRVELFDGNIGHLRLEVVEDGGPAGPTTWTGYLLDDTDSTVVATLTEDLFVADIETSTGSYRLRPVAGDLHRLTRVEVARTPTELAPLVVDQPRSRFGGLDFFDDDDEDGEVVDAGPADLDLLFAFTRAASKGAGGRRAMQAQVLNMVAWLNLSLANNGHAGRARIAGVVPTRYSNPAGDLQTSLQDLQRGSSTTMRDLHLERDRVGADMVILVQEEGNGCGLAYLMQSRSSSFSSYAFGVVLRECTASLAHEVGHLLGAQHEPENASASGLYPYSHGTVAPDAAWRTTMATWQACSGLRGACTRIPYFSDPSTFLQEEALGSAELADNAQTLVSSWTVATGFRGRSSDLDGPDRLRVRDRKTRVVLTWKKSPAADGYRILRSTDSGSFSVVGNVGSKGKRFVDRGVDTRESSHCYQVAEVRGSVQALAGPVCVGG